MTRTCYEIPIPVTIVAELLLPRLCRVTRLNRTRKSIEFIVGVILNKRICHPRNRDRLRKYIPVIVSIAARVVSVVDLEKTVVTRRCSQSDLCRLKTQVELCCLVFVITQLERRRGTRSIVNKIGRPIRIASCRFRLHLRQRCVRCKRILHHPPARIRLLDQRSGYA